MRPLHPSRQEGVSTHRHQNHLHQYREYQYRHHLRLPLRFIVKVICHRNIAIPYRLNASIFIVNANTDTLLGEKKR